MTKHNRIARGLIALVLCLATLVTTSATATAAPETEAKAKLHAKLLDSKVKVNDKARIKGVLDTAVDSDTRSADGRTLEPIVVQRLVAGVWVDVLSTDCRPNYTFRLSVSFTIAAQYQLRVYSPTTTVFSSTLLLNVVL